MSEEPKLCPYRPEVARAIPGVCGAEVSGFGPCLQDKCAMWRDAKVIQFIDGHKESLPEYCGLAGLPADRP